MNTFNSVPRPETVCQPICLFLFLTKRPYALCLVQVLKVCPIFLLGVCISVPDAYLIYIPLFQYVYELYFQ